jgi:hypothetical protein
MTAKQTIRIRKACRKVWQHNVSPVIEYDLMSSEFLLLYD